MATKRCTFTRDNGDIDITTKEGHGPNEAVARRAAISKFDWEKYHDDVEVDCQ